APDRQVPAARPREVAVCALVLDVVAGDQCPDDPDRLLERRHRRRRLAENAPRGVAATDPEIHAPAAPLVEGLEQRGGDARLTGARVRAARPQPPLLRAPAPQ